MRAIIDAVLGRTRTVITTLALLLAAGLYSFATIPKEDSPDIDIPVIYVSMTLAGISPEDAEKLLIIPMEKELRTVEGVKEMRSTGYLGGANVILEFDAGFDADAAAQDVRAGVDRVKLPDEAKEPTVNQVNISLFPILTVALSGPAPERTLLALAESLKNDVETIPSVLSADIGGERKRRMDVVIDPSLVHSYALSANDFGALLSRSNRLVAAGELDAGRGAFAVKVPGLLQTVDEVMRLPVKVDGDAVVFLKDVAKGYDTFEDRASYARVNGESGLVISVRKRIGANIIETVDAVKAMVAQKTADWPSTVDVDFMQDQSKDIRSNLLDLQNNVATAVVLVMVVVVAALGLRSGLLVGVAIPGSFLMAALALDLAGLTMNSVVLFALILAVGMLVDGAIVVAEYAERKMAEGLSRKGAYATAAQRMALPVAASTATTLAAFLPLAFWPGVVGEFMKYLPITLVATLSASLLMALIFVPSLGAMFAKPGASDPRAMKALAASQGGDIGAMGGATGAYVRLLRAALRRPGWVTVAVVAMLAVSQALYWSFGKGVELFPDAEPAGAKIRVHAQGNLSIEEKDALVREVEDRIRRLGDFENVQTIVGAGVGGRASDVIGEIDLEFTDWRSHRPADDVLADVRDLTADLAGIRVGGVKREGGPPTGKPVQIEVASHDPQALRAAADQVRQILEQTGTLIDIEDDSSAPGIEWRLKVDRAQAAKFGVDVAAVGDMVRMVTQGLKVAEYLPDGADEKIDIVLRFPNDARSIFQLDSLFVNTAMGSAPLSSFVIRAAQPKTVEIHRTDGIPVVLFKANVKPGLLADDQVRALKAKIAKIWDHPPPGVSYRFKGEDKERRDSSRFLVKAFLAALSIMTVILLTQFNSFYSAFLILTAVVMSTIGAFIGLLIFQQPFSVVMSGLGVIALAGIVVNNNIVLIDTYDRLRKTAAEETEAILRTGAQRLRPVMLTTITTLLGLTPMMFEITVDFVNREVTRGAPSMQWWSQLSIVLVCGLTFATVLTLVVTPCLLQLRANARKAWARRRAARLAASASAS